MLEKPRFSLTIKNHADKIEYRPVVGPFPVDLLTFLAHMEFMVILLGLRFQALEDVFFGYRAKLPIAAQATMPGCDRYTKIKAVQDV